MTNHVLSGLWALSIMLTPLSAQSLPCTDLDCMQVDVALASVSHAETYGLLVVSPAHIGCDAVQFVVADRHGRVVGRSHTLRLDEVQVVRIGQGYAAGLHALRVSASGCPVRPAMVRSVRLGKSSPDHGWRAAAFTQASFAP